MKRLAILLCVVSIFILSCQKANASNTSKNLDGFSGIEWGADNQSVRKILQEWNFKITLRSDKLIMASGKFAGSNCGLWLSFFNDSFYEAAIHYGEKKEKADYYELVEQLKEKHGEPTDIIGAFDTGYISTEWKFDNKCRIAAIYGLTGAYTILYYTNNAMLEEAEAAKTRQSL